MCEPLKPCPFCGGEAGNWSRGSFQHSVQCNEGEPNDWCKVSTHWCESKETATAAWNRRASRWISIDYGWPKRAGTVATWNGDAVAWQYFNSETRRFHPNRGWQTRIGTSGKVTHWTPLPDPPEVSDETT